MTKEEFMETASIEKKITNRKRAIEGKSVSWLKTRKIWRNKLTFSADSRLMRITKCRSNVH